MIYRKFKFFTAPNKRVFIISFLIKKEPSTSSNAASSVEETETSSNAPAQESSHS